MTRREKKALTFAAVVLLVFLLLQFLLLPMLAERRRLQKNIVTQESQLAEMRQLVGRGGADQIKTKGAMTEILQRRGRDFTLFSFLEQAAAKSQVKGNIETMQPVQTRQGDDAAAHTSTVELQMQHVSLTRLTHFLDLVESPHNLVAVERLNIQGGDRKGALLDVSLRVCTIEAPDQEPGEAKP